ncbi:hypothetical protein [Spirosoma gilvum]
MEKLILRSDPLVGLYRPADTQTCPPVAVKELMAPCKSEVLVTQLVAEAGSVVMPAVETYRVAMG